MKKQDFIEMGIDEETAQKLEDESQKELKGMIPKARFDEVNEQRKRAEEVVAERDRQIESLTQDRSDTETLQNRIDELIAENQKQKQGFADQLKRHALTDALRETGAIDPEYVIDKIGGVDKFYFNEDGTVMALEDTIKGFRDARPHLFGKGTGYNPAAGAPIRPDFSKMTYSELVDYQNKNPGTKFE